MHVIHGIEIGHFCRLQDTKKRAFLDASTFQKCNFVEVQEDQLFNIGF